MRHSTTRRGFLWTVASGVTVGLTGCRLDGPPPEGAASGVTRPERPLVLPFGDGTVRIATPLEVRPVAYVSMAARRVFVDRAHRDRASWLLDAHISVSTWVWRIPLPGDSPLTPIPPGDERREFEELPIGAWNPLPGPVDGDIRIVVGRAGRSLLTLECDPVQGTDHRISADPIEIERCLPGPGEPVREDFGRLGAGALHRDLECGDDGVGVDVLGWSCSPRDPSAGGGS